MINFVSSFSGNNAISTTQNRHIYWCIIGQPIVSPEANYTDNNVEVLRKKEIQTDSTSNGIPSHSSAE